MTSSLRLGPVHLRVADLARSVAYYRDVLGLRVLDRPGPQTVLGAHDADAPLVRLDEHPGARPVPRRGRLGLYHFALLLPDRAALGRFAVHLADAGVRAGAADHLVSEALYLQDPDGLGIEVYADRPRATWQTRAGELVMTTEPLDRAGLARAAAGQPWTGMPAGTVMGHLHLHVGDLGRAAAFYHGALGLDVMVRRYPGALFLAAGGYHHHLGLNTWAGPAAVPPADDDAQLLSWTIHVPRPDAVARALRDAGYPVTSTDTALHAADPWGTTLRIAGPAA